MECIRVVVSTGRETGHQRAAITAMAKLRSMGFRGVFDIQCNDKVGAELINSQTGHLYINTTPLVSQQLITMIPELASTPPTPQGTRVVPTLGTVTLSSLPFNYETAKGLTLPPADLVVSAGNDRSSYDTSVFNGKSYIGLQPTDWHMGSNLVVDQDGILTTLPTAQIMRLSSETSSRLPDISSTKPSDVEKRVLKAATSPNVNTQLVYGLYPGQAFNIDLGSLSDTGHLDQEIEMKRIIEAHLELAKKTGKASLLLLPQPPTASFPDPHLHVVSLQEKELDPTLLQPGNVIVAYTGSLQQPIFDYLMLQETNLPPVIEGCNARERCESVGRPFIHGAGMYDSLKQYSVPSGRGQKLHTLASRCLELGDPQNVPALVQYMEGILDPTSPLHTYHQERRAEFLKRPDAMETAFDALGIEYNKHIAAARKASDPSHALSAVQTEPLRKEEEAPSRTA
jgi:hypothetical protein